MSHTTATTLPRPKQSGPLRVGFLPVTDCAPLVVARELGLFDKYELAVELKREASWTNIRDKVIYGELDAAHAPATLPFVTNLGLDSDQCACVSGLVLSLQGNAITISRELWERGVRSAQTLRQEIYRNRCKRTYTFGVVYPHSSQFFLLRQWLKSAGIVPHVEVRIVVIPPSQMFPTLKLGYLDGFCVGEPWNSVAVEAAAGVCVATSADLAPLHPEKVLMVHRGFAQHRAEEHERLIAALLEACAFCDQPQNRKHLSALLAAPEYVNAPRECLEAGLLGPFTLAPHGIAGFPYLSIFHRYGANEPTDDKAIWVTSHLYELMETNILKGPGGGRSGLIRNVFRRDIFERAKTLVSQQTQEIENEIGKFETHASHQKRNPRP